MAGDWIKMRTNLWDDPRIAQICDLVEQNEAAVIGAMYWLWATADEHTEDGFMPGLSCASIDRKTGVKGFAGSLVTVGWLEANAEGVTLSRFLEHNGSSAKARAQTARRVANHKANGRVTSEVTDGDQSGNAPTVTDALPREEKRREEKNEGKDISSELRPDAPQGPCQSDNSDENTGEEPPEKAPGKRLHSTEEDRECAQWIFDVVLKVNPGAKPPSMNEWGNDVRLMREIDERSHRQICELFKWAASDTFWCTNILSPKSLRKQWDRLVLERGKVRPAAQLAPKGAYESTMAAAERAKTMIFGEGCK